MPCLTRNSYGKGTAYYIGTEPDDAFLADFMAQVCEDCGIRPVYEAEENVEVTRRVNDKATTIFVLNHNQEEAWVDFGSDRLTSLLTGEELTGRCRIAGRDAFVLKKED